MEAQEFYKKIGNQVRRYRQERGMSQEKLAEILDKSNDTISNIERGIYPPRMETVLALAQALDVPPYQLFMISEYKTEDREKQQALDDITSQLQDKPLTFIDIVREQVQALIRAYKTAPDKQDDNR